MSTSTPPPLRVVYYAGPSGSPYRLLRHLVSFARSASIEDSPTARDAELLWPHRDRVVPLHVSLVVTRGLAWHVPIEELASESDEARWELEALRRAESVVFLADGRVTGLGFNRRFTELLRADLIGAGRRPDEMPVLFQIHRYGPSEVPETPVLELERAMGWARGAYVEVFPREKLGAREALDGALDLTHPC